jgi:mycofactocin system glycosyltransferase
VTAPTAPPRVWPDRWLRRWPGRILAGGSPWRLVRVKDPVWTVVSSSVRTGTAPPSRVVDTLVDRGILHPRPAPRTGPHDVTVVVPAYGRPAALARCLRALSIRGAGVGPAVIVVDDATPDPSPVREVAAAAGARYLRLPDNRGPAAARNAGAALATTGLVAFVDSDCQVSPGWLDRLVPFFDDPRVAAVAPRVTPAGLRARSPLARYERAGSALDMGTHPALVRPGARLGFVPSATLVVRRDLVSFDEQLRLGEDVDLVWRLADAGHHVRYEPTVVVRHDPSGSLPQWACRRYEYGTSTVDLNHRHPGRLTPVRVSPWNLAAIGLVGLGRPVAGAATAVAATGLLARRLRQQDIGTGVAARVVGAGLAADAVAIGHALRREYWPLGVAAMLVAPRSRLGRVAVGLMVAPVLADWVRLRPPLDPVRYLGLRLLADAAYGTGVLASCLRRRTVEPLRPRLRR